MSDQDESLSWSQKRLLDSMDELELELARLDRMMVIVAQRNENPFTHQEVQEQKANVHSAVMAVFRQLPRATIRERMQPYWEDAVLYDDGERYIHGLKTLEQFQAAVYKEEHEVQTRHSGTETVAEWNVQLLPDRAYRRCYDMFTEVLERLGYIDPPNKPDVIGVLGPNGGEDSAHETVQSTATSD